jgi:hypothetical protein
MREGRFPVSEVDEAILEDLVLEDDGEIVHL